MITTSRDVNLKGTNREYQASYNNSPELLHSVSNISVTAFGATRQRAIFNCKIALLALAQKLKDDLTKKETV